MNNVFKKRTWIYARSFAIDFGLAVIPVNTNCTTNHLYFDD